MTKRLAEVAKKAGVSEATVSRVLNGRNGVSEATRASVLTALDVLGYERPTKLRGERARLVGLVLPELQNPIFPALAEVVTASLAQRGFTPAAVRPHDRRRARARLRRDAARPPGLRRRLRRRLVRAGRRRARPLPAADRPPAAGRAGQRRRRRPGLPAGLDRRRGRGRAGVRASELARATSGSAWCSARRTTCRRAASWPRWSRSPAGRGDAWCVERTSFSMEGARRRRGAS